MGWRGGWALRDNRESGGEVAGGKRAGGRARSAGDFCNFSMKITRFDAYFGQNSYFKQ